MLDKLVEFLSNKKICILGFGREGRATYRFLKENNINNITIVDQNDQEVKPCISGPHYLDNLDIYDLIIKTPGVSLKNIDITSFENKITSELELVLEYVKCKTIGITGSKGKSTTTSLIYRMLIDQGKKAFLLGNIGTAIFEYINEFTEDTYLVIEMSALQLEYIKKSPDIAVITNLYEEHLDHFGTKERYYNSKLNIFKFQDNTKYGIYSGDNEELSNRIKNNKYSSKLISVGFNNENVYCDNKYIYINNEKVYDCSDSRNLVGNHNIIDIMLALVVASILKLNMSNCVKTIDDFKPLEHRMELVGTYNDVIFYNDAIATIPAATINCISALKNVDTLITGGKDRGIDYQPLIDYLNHSNVSNVICMPETGYKIADKINKNIYKVEELEDAVKLAKEITKKGKICVLSPSAASYNRFKNFEEKGTKYKEYVKGL